MRYSAASCASILIAGVIGFGLSACAARSTEPVAPAPSSATGKERLSDKASDEQRVDNCNVPADRRGTRPRPDCADRR